MVFEDFKEEIINNKIVVVYGLAGINRLDYVKQAAAEIGRFNYVSLRNEKIRDAARKDPKALMLSIDKMGNCIIDGLEIYPDLISNINKEHNNRIIFISSLKIDAQEEVKAINFSLPSIREMNNEQVLDFNSNIKSFVNNVSKVNYVNKDSLIKTIKDGLLNTQIKNYKGDKVYIERSVNEHSDYYKLKFQSNKIYDLLKLISKNVGDNIQVLDTANILDISYELCTKWLKILEDSNVIWFLEPLEGKRTNKKRRLYFSDTGMLYRLLDEDDEQINILIENYVINNVRNSFLSTCKEPPIHYYKDDRGKEIKLVVNDGDEIIPINIINDKDMEEECEKKMKEFCKIKEYKNNVKFRIFFSMQNKIKTEDKKIYIPIFMA